MELMQHQLDVIDLLDNGKILYGNTGDGKSLAAFAYYLKAEAPKNIYVITTARKRDSLDWERTGASLTLGEDEESTVAGVLTVDSWNRLDMYEKVEDSFFIFDEQRLIGHGAWVKSFLKIAKKNRWILLSATPGDNWMDYAPVFIANGFYKNMTDFKMKHVLYEPYVRYPKIRGYLGERKLELLRNEILVEMPFEKHTTRYYNYLEVGYDFEKIRRIQKERWHIFEDRPIKDAAEMWRLMRQVNNMDPSRLEMVEKLLTCHDRLIIFYNFDYELEILRTLEKVVFVAEWNGHKHEPVPNSNRWVYLVQYVAGAEAWNCIETDGMILYSLPDSYKLFTQAPGRFDRLNTKYTNLYIYLFVSNLIVDRKIRASLAQKRDFNERKYVRELEMYGGSMSDNLEENLEACQI